MKITKAVEIMESKYGLNLMDIVRDMNIGDLETEEAVLVQMVVNTNHVAAIDGLYKEIAALKETITSLTGTTEDYDGVMFS